MSFASQKAKAKATSYSIYACFSIHFNATRRKTSQADRLIKLIESRLWTWFNREPSMASRLCARTWGTWRFRSVNTPLSWKFFFFKTAQDVNVFHSLHKGQHIMTYIRTAWYQYKCDKPWERHPILEMWEDVTERNHPHLQSWTCSPVFSQRLKQLGTGASSRILCWSFAWGDSEKLVAPDPHGILPHLDVLDPDCFDLVSLAGSHSNPSWTWAVRRVEWVNRGCPWETQDFQQSQGPQSTRKRRRRNRRPVSFTQTRAPHSAFTPLDL